MPANREYTGWLLAPTAAAAVLFALLQPKPVGHSPSPSQAEKQRNDAKASALDAFPITGPAPEGPLKPIWDFLGLQPRTTPEKAAAEAKRYSLATSQGRLVVTEEPPQKNVLYRWPDVSERRGWTFRFLIATVPDPLESGFGYIFDQIVESLQRAIEVDGYVIDRIWMPWSRSATTDDRRFRLHDKHPGLLLFRKVSAGVDDDSTSRRCLLALLLVGETPTAGMNKNAFHNAIKVIHDYAEGEGKEERIRVIGPCYSGSATSLRLALCDVRKSLKGSGREPRIKVVCGSASGFSHEEFIRSLPDETWIKKSAPGEERPFESTVLPSNVILCWMRKYLGNPTAPMLGKPAAPIIKLHEGNTSFGQFPVKLAGEDDLWSPRDFIQIPYPLHISQLRTSYTKEQLARLESQGLPHAGRNLQFPLEADGAEEGRDAIRSQSPLVTAAVNELVLDNVVSVISKAHVRYICLVSTDTQDTIFLARLIRDRYPDVQLLTVGSDLLFTHDDYNYITRGMLVGSTYPLHLSAQRWSDVPQGRFRTRIMFPMDGCQGYYNAALVQLAAQHEDQGNSEQAKSLRSSMIDYGWEREEDGATRPPLWINVVSSDGQLVPVTHISPLHYMVSANPDPSMVSAGPDPCRYLYRRSPPPLPPGKPREDWGRVFFPIGVLGLFMIFLFANVWFFRKAWKYLRNSRWNGSVPDRCARYKQRIDFAVLCLAQVLFYLVIAELAWTPLHAGIWKRDWLQGGATVFMLGASIIMVGTAWVHLVKAHRLEIRGWEWDVRWRYYNDLFVNRDPMHFLPNWLDAIFNPRFWIFASDAFMFLLVTLTTMCCGWRMVRAAVHELHVQDIIYFERVTMISNGVSPLPPRFFFCTALFSWSYFLVKRLYLANRCHIDPPFPELRVGRGQATMHALHTLDKRVRSELMPPSTFQNHFCWCAGAFILASFSVALLWDRLIPPLDGVLFGYMALGGFFVGSFLILFTLLQFHFAWRSLRRMLRFLTLLPMQSAFERLPDKVVATFGHFLFSLRPHHSYMAVAVQQFRLTVDRSSAFQAELQRLTMVEAEDRSQMLDKAIAGAVGRAMQEAFHPSPPPMAVDFEKELDPADERDLAPTVKTQAQEWGGRTGQDSRQFAVSCLQVLHHFWPARVVEDAFGRTSHGDARVPAKPTAFLSLPKGNAIREWAVAAEDFVAIEIIRYLSQFIVQIRNLLVCLTLSSVLLVLAATVYPFFPQQQLLLYLTLLGTGAAASIAIFLIQLNRDELVSRITRSTPNRFTPDLSFLHGTLVYVLPIAAGLVVQFPLVTSTLRSLFDPLLHLLK